MFNIFPPFPLFLRLQKWRPVAKFKLVSHNYPHIQWISPFVFIRKHLHNEPQNQRLNLQLFCFDYSSQKKTQQEYSLRYFT